MGAKLSHSIWLTAATAVKAPRTLKLPGRKPSAEGALETDSEGKCIAAPEATRAPQYTSRIRLRQFTGGGGGGPGGGGGGGAGGGGLSETIFSVHWPMWFDVSRS